MPPQQWPPTSSDLNSVDYSVWEYCEKVYNTPITDVDKLKQRMRTDRTKLDHVVIGAAICQWCHRLSACIKPGHGHFEHCLSLTFIIVLLVILFVADVDDMNSYALYVGLFLHTVHSGVMMW